MEPIFDILLPRHTLEEALGSELAKQYRLLRGEKHIYMPVRSGHHYLCSCGAVNPEGAACEACGSRPELLDRAFLEQLRREAEVRLEQEAQEQARQEALRLEEEKRLRRKKRLRLAAVIGAAAAALALAVGGFWGITRIAIPAGHYSKALAALAEKDYQQAHRQFVLAGSYRDAEAYLARFYTPYVMTRSTVGDFTNQTEYEYDSGGRLLRTVERQLAPGADGEPVDTQEPVVYTRTYDENGNLLTYEDWYGRREYAYNEQGDVISEEAYQNDGQHDYSKTFLYTYDEKGRIAMAAEICSELITVNYSYEQTVWYTYDEKDRVISQVTEANYPAQGESCYRSTVTWRYDSEDRPVEKVEVLKGTYISSIDNRKVSTWTYDALGRELLYEYVVEYEDNSGLNMTQTRTASYDRRGNMTEQVTVYNFPSDSQRNVTARATWEYNWEGRLVKEAQVTVYTDATWQENQGFSRSCEYSYDLLGRRVGIEQAWDHPHDLSKQKNAYTFGLDGMATQMTSRYTWGDGSWSESTTVYNANGLAERETYASEDDSGVHEYAYAYFFFPEGTEMPTQSATGGYLYGDGYYNG